GHQRVRAQGEPTHGRDLLALELLPEQPRDELQAVGVQARLAHIDVVVGSRSGAQDELAEAHGTIEEHLAQAVSFCGWHGLRVDGCQGGSGPEGLWILCLSFRFARARVKALRGGGGPFGWLTSYDAGPTMLALRC